MSEHARLSCSDKAWPKCPGSVRENAAYPDISGEAAISGTGSHLLLEMCLKAGVRAERYEGEIIGINHPDNPGGWNVDHDRCVRVQMCLDYVTRRVRELREMFPGCKIVVESESHSHPGKLIGRDDWWGTCDITITVTNDHKFCLYLEVCDYKDGREYVPIEDNSQTQGYLFGRMRPFIGSGPDGVRPFFPEKIGQVRQTIVQPKCKPPVRYLDQSGVEAFEAFENLRVATHRTDEPDAPLIPDQQNGKGHCRWCKHGRAGNCHALNNRTLTEANSAMQQLSTSGEGSALFELTTVADISLMSDEQLTALYDKEAPVMQIFQHIKEEVQRRINERPVNGFAMQPGKGSNLWAVSEAEVEKVLKGQRVKAEDIYPKKLVSPAQALKIPYLTDIQRKNIENKLIVYKSGEEKLTRVKYERPTLTAEEMFGGVSKPTPVSLPDFSGEPLFTAAEEPVPDFGGEEVPDFSNEETPDFS